MNIYKILFPLFTFLHPIDNSLLCYNNIMYDINKIRSKRLTG